LTTQGLPRWQGDANCSLNLGILLLFHRLCVFSYLSGLKSILNRFSFTEGRRRAVQDAWTWSSCARIWVCASVYVYRIHMKGTPLSRDPFVGFNKAQRSSPFPPFPSFPLRFVQHRIPPFKQIFTLFFAESIDSFCTLVRRSVSLIVLHSPPLLLLVDMWPVMLEPEFASISHLGLSRMH